MSRGPDAPENVQFAIRANAEGAELDLGDGFWDDTDGCGVALELRIEAVCAELRLALLSVAGLSAIRH